MGKGYLKYVNFEYKPTSNDMICLFKFKPEKNRTRKEVAGAIAAESSTGTWTKLSTVSEKKQLTLGAKVFEVKGDYTKIAYPSELFENGNIPQILSAIAGNIFGMKEVETLRLEDIKWPRKIINSFKGPKFGIRGVRKITKIKKRPLSGTIIKPKVGLNEKQHAKVAYEAWLGGLDIVKDDENLTCQSFNKFKKRARETIKLKNKAEKETGEKKIYMANVTAETNEMIKRAKYLKELGNEYLMVDVLTVGWSALQTLRDENEKLKLVLHGHRAMHAALTRNKEHGISMLALAQCSRLAGMDQLHIGTAVGKMEGEKQEIRTILDNIEKQKVPETKRNFSQNWGKMKPVFSVCSGGLHPGHIPKLMEFFGNDIIIQAGGGAHGHPDGTKKGAMAVRQAIDACMKNISLKEYAKTHPELKKAIEKWGVYNG